MSIDQKQIEMDYYEYRLEANEMVYYEYKPEANLMRYYVYKTKANRNGLLSV